MKPIIEVNGDQSFLVRLGTEISPVIHKRVKQYSQLLSEKKIEGVTSITISYTDVCVSYNPMVINYKELVKKLKSIDIENYSNTSGSVKTLSIPVCYGGNYGPDLNIVAGHNKLSPEEVIRLHSETPYLIYMLGFSPGFVYLGGLNQAIETPRKEVPRQKIEAGAVGIAGNQTGVYPISSPGGWQIIGQTPVKMFDPQRTPPVLIESGDYIKFEPISESEYKRLEEAISEGNYQPVINTQLINEE